ncbi:hypothetical protein B0J18DRAFT_423106 [Chaetomium sp. MPI-SDFR-AT-0129]|nr:hypothetical protein B0J18DRAFT_423106 [Chaetomium sp. MPI-SDFR-AT-0129]
MWYCSALSILLTLPMPMPRNYQDLQKWLLPQVYRNGIGYGCSKPLKGLVPNGEFPHWRPRRPSEISVACLGLEHHGSYCDVDLSLTPVYI